VPKNGYRSGIFIPLLFAIKPFIDLAWNIRLLPMGEYVLNPLQITAFLVFITTGYLYFFRNDNRRIFNERVIWVFLVLWLFTAITAVLFYNQTIMYAMNRLLRSFDAYFIYFIGSRYIENERDKLRIIGIIWITTFLLGILSTVQYFGGNYAIDINNAVERFDGFYNDPGTPSYNAVIALMFGALYLELYKKERLLVPPLIKMAFIFTILVSAFILKITVTRSAYLMLLVFITMWFGLYKRNTFIIIPLLIISMFYVYEKSEDIHQRIEPEIKFMTEGEFSIEKARSLGEGRIAIWERVLTYYDQDYNLFQKLIGTNENFDAHNQYIAYLTQIGIMGLTLFLIILIRFYRQLIYLYEKYKQPDIYMCLVLLTVFVVYGLVGHPFDYTTIMWYLMILLSIINVYTFVPALDTSSEY